MTEEEAKTKWCPFYRASIAMSPSDDREVIDNRNDDPMSGPKCIGSACMAFRTMPGYRGADGDRIEPVSYCGLAGKP